MMVNNDWADGRFHWCPTVLVGIDEVGAEAVELCLGNIEEAVEEGADVARLLLLKHLDRKWWFRDYDWHPSEGGVTVDRGINQWEEINGDDTVRKVNGLLARPTRGSLSFPPVAELAVVLVGQLERGEQTADVIRRIRARWERHVHPRNLHWFCLSRLSDTFLEDSEWETARSSLNALISVPPSDTSLHPTARGSRVVDHCFVVSNHCATGWTLGDDEVGVKEVMGQILARFLLSDVWGRNGFLGTRSNASARDRPGMVSALGWCAEANVDYHQQMLQLHLAQRLCDLWQRPYPDNPELREQLAKECFSELEEADLVPRSMAEIPQRGQGFDLDPVSLQRELDFAIYRFLPKSTASYNRWIEDRSEIIKKHSDDYINVVGAKMVDFVKENGGFDATVEVLNDLGRELVKKADEAAIASTFPSKPPFGTARIRTDQAFRKLSKSINLVPDARSAVFWGILAALPAFLALFAHSNPGFNLAGSALLLLGCAGLSLFIARLGERGVRRDFETARGQPGSYHRDLLKYYREETKELLLFERKRRVDALRERMRELAKVSYDLRQEFEQQAHQLELRNGSQGGPRRQPDGIHPRIEVRQEPFPEDDGDLYEKFLQGNPFSIRNIWWNTSPEAPTVIWNISGLRSTIARFCREFVSELPRDVGSDTSSWGSPSQIREWIYLASPLVPPDLAQNSTKQREVMFWGWPEEEAKVRGLLSQGRLVTMPYQGTRAVLTELDLTEAVLASSEQSP